MRKYVKKIIYINIVYNYSICIYVYVFMYMHDQCTDATECRERSTKICCHMPNQLHEHKIKTMESSRGLMNAVAVTTSVS